MSLFFRVLHLYYKSIILLMNIVCNISEQVDFLRYVTPYAYAEASNIISEAKLDIGLITIGTIIALIGVAVSSIKYYKKDIAA